MGNTCSFLAACLRQSHQPRPAREPNRFSPTSVESPEIRLKLSEIISAYPIGDVMNPWKLEIREHEDDKNRSFTPLPVVLLASSQLEKLNFRPLDESLLDFFKDAGKIPGEIFPTPSQTTALANSHTEMTWDGSRMVAVNFSKGYRIDYGYSEEFVTRAVHQISNDIASDAESLAGYNSERMLIGVVLTVTLGTLEIVGLPRRDFKKLATTDDLWVFEKIRSCYGRRRRTGVVGCGMVCFLLEKVASNEWMVAKSTRVDGWNNQILQYFNQSEDSLPTMISESTQVGTKELVEMMP